MWTWIEHVFGVFFGYSSLPFVLGLILAATTIVDAIVGGKKPRELAVKLGVVSLTILLLITQFVSGKAAAAKHKQELDAQQAALSAAFKLATDQILAATNQTAVDLRQSAKDQTDAIKRQAQQQFAQLQGATLGSKTCPVVGLTASMWHGAPDMLTLINRDTTNMYGIHIEVLEPLPGVSPTSPKYNRRQVFDLAQLNAQRAAHFPYSLTVQNGSTFIQANVSTRAAACVEYLRLQNKGAAAADGWNVTSDERARVDGNFFYRMVDGKVLLDSEPPPPKRKRP